MHALLLADDSDEMAILSFVLKTHRILCIDQPGYQGGDEQVE